MLLPDQIMHDRVQECLDASSRPHGRSCERPRAGPGRGRLCALLIGFIPLEMLDFVVDPRDQRLIGNPDHGGEWMIDMYLHAVDK
jgi:hypothetical protein